MALDDRSWSLSVDNDSKMTVQHLLSLMDSDNDIDNNKPVDSCH